MVLSMEENNKSQEIRNRESWLKVIIILLFAFIIAWKLATSTINFNFSDFKFTDLLSLLLSIFAIGMSVQFYFKANDTANTFYDNTYKFTKDFSEILGRIEAVFGERLRHLDEGYAGLRDKFEKMPIDPVRAEKQVKKEEEEVKKTEQERNKLIETLAEKARLQEDEKDELFKKLREKDVMLENAKRELVFLQKRFARSEISSDESSSFGFDSAFARYIRHRLINEMGREVINEAPPGVVIRRFDSVKDDLHKAFIADMKKYGLIDSKSTLTERGVEILKEMAKV